jgi:hypothetical protein
MTNNWKPMRVDAQNLVMGQRIPSRGYILRKGMKTLKVSSKTGQLWFFHSRRQAEAVCKKLNEEEGLNYEEHQDFCA